MRSTLPETHKVLINLTVALAELNTWLDLLYEIHGAHSDPAEGTSQRTRVKTKLLPFYLDEVSRDGDAPFEHFTNQLKPSVATKNRADQLAQLGRRQLFKAESWSAPNVGGVTRCLVGEAHAKFATFPELVFDIAEDTGSPRVLAMHCRLPQVPGDRHRGRRHLRSHRSRRCSVRGRPVLHGWPRLRRGRTHRQSAPRNGAARSMASLHRQVTGAPNGAQRPSSELVTKP